MVFFAQNSVFSKASGANFAEGAHIMPLFNYLIVKFPVFLIVKMFSLLSQ